MQIPPDCAEVVRSWNRCHGAFYRVRECDLRWNIREQELVGYRRGELAGVPVIFAAATEPGAREHIPSLGLWVSLYGEIEAGREDEFAAAAEAHALREGRNRIAIGSDEFHFLPGIPVEDDAGKRLAAAFTARGFKAADCVDYVGDPANEACAEYVRQAREEASRRGWTLRRAEGAADYAAMAAFLEPEFSARWFREFRCWRDRADTARGFWNLLRDENGRVIGFSRLGKRGRIADPERGWTPGSLRLPLDSGTGWRDTDSCLGPIGVAKAERGRGAGKLLLGLSIHELSLQGAGLTCIDWTNAYNYYTPLGFSIVRRYQTVWKELAG